MPLMRNNCTFMQKMKNWFRIGKGLLSGIGQSMYPHLTEKIAEIFFEVGSDGADRNTTDNQSSFGMTDGSQLRERVGGVETFITF